MEWQKIAMASDHAGYQLKSFLVKNLRLSGMEVVDLGAPNGEASVDYPDFAKLLAEQVNLKLVDAGIAICGTGIGMNIAMNRYPTIRAACVWSEFTAQMAKAHNDANVICLGARILMEDEALKLVRVWMRTEFEAGRHKKRLEKLARMGPNC